MQKKKKKSYIKWTDFIFSGIVCLVLIVMLIFSIVLQFCENSYCRNIPVYRVVKTESMSIKHIKNTYLEANNLDDQIQAFDLIRVEKLPDEWDLELYDIVVYETDGMLIVHRIVEIEEPNELHPDCRHFRLQGDAIDSPDRFPVLYEQMRAIYRGDRIPFVGSFVLFMQSPAGWLCALLVLFCIIVTPIIERKLQKAKDIRIQLYTTQSESDDDKQHIAGGNNND